LPETSPGTFVLDVEFVLYRERRSDKTAVKILESAPLKSLTYVNGAAACAAWQQRFPMAKRLLKECAGTGATPLI
jgi:hypothetical protein